jgi:hypothetical protein
LCDSLPVRNISNQGEAILFFNAFHAFRTVQVKQNCLELNGTYMFYVYAVDVNILGGNVQVIKTIFSSC